MSFRREFQSRDTQKVFETRTSTFDQMKAEDGARAQSPSMVHETNYFGSKFEDACWRTVLFASPTVGERLMGAPRLGKVRFAWHDARSPRR